MNRRERRRRARHERRRAASPRSPDPHADRSLERLFDEAVAERDGGRFAEAEATCRRILARSPEHAAAFSLLGVVHCQTGRAEEGIALIRRAVDLEPGEASFHNNLGTALSSLGRQSDALRAYERALELEPGYVQAMNNIGSTLRALGRLEDARAHYERALALAPGYAEAWSNYGNVLMDLERIGEAVSAYERALAADPTYAIAHNNIGNALKRFGRYADAGDAYRRALELAPGYADALNNAAEALKELGRVEQALPLYRRAVEADPDHAGIHSNLCLALNYVPLIDDVEVRAEHRRWARRHAGRPCPAAAAHANAPEPERRLRIGYVSADFRRHSVAYFIEPVLRAHDGRALEVYCYSAVIHPDPTTRRLRGLADHWREIGAVADADAARLVREDAIDVLVDLSGHTMDNRLGLFALKPAPLQVGWLGYPNWTGLDAIDYRLTDRWADPEGEDRIPSERLLRLAEGFLCYAPPDDAPDPAGGAGAAVTFCSCNNLAKVNEAVIDAWSEVLMRVPSSRLLLKTKPLADASVRAELVSRFGARGVAAERLSLMGWITEGSHLAVYREADIGLDTFPYNGTTTTCEALWMGVPVITLAGDRHAGRVGASLLTRIGLADLVAPNAETYVERAATLAADAERRATLRGTLRQRFGRSGLTDGARFTRSLEEAFRRIWREWCRTRP